MVAVPAAEQDAGVVVIRGVEGTGFTVTVRVNVAPGQVPAVGVIV